MRKIAYLALAAFSACIMSCTKEQAEQVSTPKNMAELAKMMLKDKNCPYNSEVKVYDPTGKYYVRYGISSHDEGVVKAAVNDLQATQLSLLDEKPVTPSAASKLQAKEPEMRASDIKRTLHLIELERQIGDFKVYALGLKDPHSKQNGYVYSYSFITLTINGCGGITLTNCWVYPNTNYHSYEGFYGWVGDETKTLAFNETYTFSGGGYTNHSILSAPSYVNSSYTNNNIIYFYSF